ncbi:hypothetical protein EDB83DRAFT_88691 [Lactarius deliciosus]|nr:hypothetical protein EDB83DRAFT_88691 [Lactarius deliciosus]
MFRSVLYLFALAHSSLTREMFGARRRTIKPNSSFASAAQIADWGRTNTVRDQYTDSKLIRGLFTVQYTYEETKPDRNRYRKDHH